MVGSRNEKACLIGLCVLIAEDDFLIALDVAEQVEALGAEVLGPVAAAIDGIALVRRTRPHLAFLDMQLRDGFVTPLAGALQQLEVPFALVTGYLGEELGNPAFHRAPRLPKPCSQAAFIQMAGMLRDEIVRRSAHDL